MNIFKIPSPNELKLTADEYKTILYKDIDPLILCLYGSESDSEDEFTLTSIQTMQRDTTIKDEPSRSDHTHMKSEVIKQEDVKSDVMRTKINDAKDADEINISVKVDDPVTLKWLASNFECHADYSIPRGDMFNMFTQYCLEGGIKMMCNQATFGKSVRATFPTLKTRRIGIRGQSRYHYDGIRPKMNSYMSDKLIPRKNLNVRLQVDWTEYNAECHQERQEIELGPNYPKDHLVTILIPQYPTVNTVLMEETSQEEISMFLMMYRCYTVDILKTIIQTRFTHLERITSTFWKNLPTEMTKILTHNDTLQVMRTCDSMIYDCAIKLLIPSCLIPIPIGMIRLLEKTFGVAYVTHHRSALSMCPVELQKQSMEEVINFSKKLAERLNLCNLCGNARETLQCRETTQCIRDLIKRLDPKHIADCAGFPVQSVGYQTLYDRIESGIYDFQGLLAERAKFDRYISWLKSLTLHVVNSVSNRGGNHQDIARVIVLEFSFITGIIAREISFDASETVQRAFHDVEAFFISYVKFLLETERFSQK